MCVFRYVQKADAVATIEVGRHGMSDNLRLPAKYSAAMDSGDTDAVFEFWSEDFHSHVTERVSPE
jgi:hypothetical protein